MLLNNKLILINLVISSSQVDVVDTGVLFL